MKPFDIGMTLTLMLFVIFTWADHGLIPALVTLTHISIGAAAVLFVDKKVFPNDTP